MSSTDLTTFITELVGEVPEGLEWMSYLFSWLLLFFGLFVVLKIILKFLSLFDFRNKDQEVL